MPVPDDIGSYKNDRVIDSFLENYYFQRGEAEEVFRDVVSWLWIASQNPENASIGMYHPMQVMDKMWHTFMSFTREYESFCVTKLGRKVHHEPHSRREQIDLLMASDNLEKKLEEMKGDVADFQAHVYDVLGADVVLRWFMTYPHVYSPDELLRRTRPQSSERGFLLIRSLRSANRTEVLEELAKTHEIALWCGGPNCGPQCREE